MENKAAAQSGKVFEWPQPESPGRILIVDDAFSIRLLLRTVLTEAGHFIAGEASTGREAVNMYRLFRPDVVLMDITMPEQDGLSAMEEILRASPGAQVVVCTAMGFKKVATEALRRGAADFVAKPFSPKSVLAAVRGALARARAAAAAESLAGERASTGQGAQRSSRAKPPAKKKDTPSGRRGAAVSAEG
ncbi:MAG: response regulator [Patescibacteria group bacterium]